MPDTDPDTGNDIESLSDRIIGYLVDMDLPADRSENGPFILRFGSSLVLVGLFEQGGDSWVRIASTVLRGFRPNLELVTRVLHLNTEVLFGAFLVFEDDTLAFSVTLPGEDLAYSTFRRALEYVAWVSDTYDDELQELAGGLRAEDFLEADSP